MEKVGVIDKSAYDTLKKTYQGIDNSTVPLYMKVDCTEKQQQKKFSPFVEVNHHNGKVFHIHKTTAVWLFQECERVSTDHLFRVQAKQPYSSCNKLNYFQLNKAVHMSVAYQQSYKVFKLVIFVFLKTKDNAR